MRVPRLEVDTGSLAEYRCLRFRGAMVLMTLPETHDALVAALADRPRALVLDLREVTDVDPAAMGLLLRARDRLRQEGGELLLLVGSRADRPLGPAVMLQVAGLDHVLRLFTDDESLLRDYAPALSSAG